MKIVEGRENFSGEKLFPPFHKPHPSLSKDFCVYRIPVHSFSGADRHQKNNFFKEEQR